MPGRFATLILRMPKYVSTRSSLVARPERGLDLVQERIVQRPEPGVGDGDLELDFLRTFGHGLRGLRQIAGLEPQRQRRCWPGRRRSAGP